MKLTGKLLLINTPPPHLFNDEIKVNESIVIDVIFIDVFSTVVMYFGTRPKVTYVLFSGFCTTTTTECALGLGFIHTTTHRTCRISTIFHRWNWLTNWVNHSFPTSSCWVFFLPPVKNFYLRPFTVSWCHPTAPSLNSTRLISKWVSYLFDLHAWCSVCEYTWGVSNVIFRYLSSSRIKTGSNRNGKR